jgi:hypothetical protein
MGKGLTLQFKSAYLDNFRASHAACRTRCAWAECSSKNQVSPGGTATWSTFPQRVTRFHRGT